MNPTSLSLLDRLKVARPEASDWNRLQGIYLPLIERWLGRVPGLGDESADLAQEVLVVVFREVPRFDRQREGSFRAWLRQVTVNKIRELPAGSVIGGPPSGSIRPTGFSNGCPTRTATSPASGTGIMTSTSSKSSWRSCSPTSLRRPGRRSAGSASMAFRPGGWPRNWA